MVGACPRSWTATGANGSLGPQPATASAPSSRLSSVRNRGRRRFISPPTNSNVSSWPELTRRIVAVGVSGPSLVGVAFGAAAAGFVAEVGAGEDKYARRPERHLEDRPLVGVLGLVGHLPCGRLVRACQVDVADGGAPAVIHPLWSILA